MRYIKKASFKKLACSFGNVFLGLFMFGSSFAQQEKSFLTSNKIAILNYPSTWKQAKMETSGEITLNAPENTLFKPCKLKMEVTPIQAEYKGIDVRELAEVELKMLKATPKENANLVVEQSAFQTFKGKEWWVIHGKIKQGKDEFLLDNFKTIHSDQVYTVSYVSSEKNFEKYSPEVLKMVQNIEFLTKDATVYNKDADQDKATTNTTVPGTKSSPSVKSPPTAAPEKIKKNTTEVLPGKEPGATGKITFTYSGKPVTLKTVRAADGNIWLQQSLGSKRVAEELSDQEARGDLFQWGRWDDSHQMRKPANTRKVELKPNNPSGLSKTGKNPFYYIVISTWWIRGDGTWNASTPAEVTETNGCDPCKAMGNGWRLPTQKEWAQVGEKEFITDANGGFMSNLKLSLEGYRDPETALLDEYNVVGSYWTSDSKESMGVGFNAGIDPHLRYYLRGTGLSIRCIRGSAN